ncbi:helix-turn-helix domain-containing protein [Streptomyces noursei]|uniref:helix-turn-helix domain-containing protein n=1 Tax=Streptomyces noursei TaxID=1971 RepID=UPI0035E3F023
MSFLLSRNCSVVLLVGGAWLSLGICGGWLLRGGRWCGCGWWPRWSPGRWARTGRRPRWFGVAERSVGSWWRAYQAGGREALAAKRVRRPGPHELISDEERAVLFQAMADYTPEQLLIGGPLWTRPWWRS